MKWKVDYLELDLSSLLILKILCFVQILFFFYSQNLYFFHVKNIFKHKFNFQIFFFQYHIFNVQTHTKQSFRLAKKGKIFLCCIQWYRLRGWGVEGMTWKGLRTVMLSVSPFVLFDSTYIYMIDRSENEVIFIFILYSAKL